MQVFRTVSARLAELIRRPWLMQDRTWALGLFLACLVLYWPTLSPSVVVGDGGEFQMVSYLFGVPHRTGYPLFVLLGWVATHLPLGGDVAYRLTLLSMFSASAAMALVLPPLRELDVRKGVAVISTLLLASAPRLWMHAAAAEVYTLAVLFVVLGSWLLLRWGKGKTPLWVATLVFGGPDPSHHVSPPGTRGAGLCLARRAQVTSAPAAVATGAGNPASPVAPVCLDTTARGPLPGPARVPGRHSGSPQGCGVGLVSAWYMSAGIVDFFLVTDYSGDVVSGRGRTQS